MNMNDVFNTAEGVNVSLMRLNIMPSTIIWVKVKRERREKMFGTYYDIIDFWTYELICEDKK